MTVAFLFCLDARTLLSAVYILENYLRCRFLRLQNFTRRISLQFVSWENVPRITDLDTTRHNPSPAPLSFRLRDPSSSSGL
jgi:hypothetical protein